MPDYPEPPTAGERLTNCHTTNKGTEIQEIVKKTGNQVWKLRIFDGHTSGNLLLRDVSYHHSCLVNFSPAV